MRGLIFDGLYIGLSLKLDCKRPVERSAFLSIFRSSGARLFKLALQRIAASLLVQLAITTHNTRKLR